MLSKVLAGCVVLIFIALGILFFMVTPEVTQVIQHFMRGEVVKTKQINFELPKFIDD